MNIKTAKKLNITDLSGVYLFMDKNEAVLYIGKANNLKKRILDHFKQTVFPDTIVIPKISRIETITTKNEKEALLLENRLIKQYLPKYNTQWKDDKNYSFVALTNEDFPCVFTTGIVNEIGPFAPRITHLLR